MSAAAARVSASTLERIAAFLRAELTPNRARTRAFLRTLVALLLASFVILTFRPPDAFWTLSFVLLAATPTVGSSAKNAIGRVMVTTLGAGVAVLVVILAFDEPWLFVTLQALVIGLVLLLARSTPVGAVLLAGGAAFAVVTGNDLRLGPAGWITLAFYRVLQGATGSVLAVLADLTFWPDDPLVVLRVSLVESVERVEAHLRGDPVLLDPASLGRQLELLQNAEIRHPAMAHRRAELSALILDTARLIDETLHYERTRELPAHARALLAQGCKRLREVHEAMLFEPPPAPPQPPLPPARFGLSQLSASAFAPARRSALKVALSAFLAALLANVLQLSPAGALFPCLVIGMQVSNGTSLSKSLVPIVALTGALVVLLFVYALAMPNVDDLGSFLVVTALALAPTTWLVVSGPRVRSAGFFSTVVVSQGLFTVFSASDALQPSVVAALSYAVGVVVTGVVDRYVWPVDGRAGMWLRAAQMMRAAAEFHRVTDPRVVLAPNREPRWSIHHDLVTLVQLRSERTPLPGTPWFNPEEEALRLATETQHRVAARIDEARRELAGGELPPDAIQERERIAQDLDVQAASIDRHLFRGS